MALPPDITEDMARQVKCPACGAKVNTRCRADTGTGGGTWMNVAHPARQLSYAIINNLLG